MRILITGGYGCIGSWIAKELLARRAPVHVYDLQEDPRRMRLIMGAEEVAQIGFVPGDVCDVNSLRRALEQREIEAVIHLAALQVPACRADPMLAAQVNVIGMLAVFEAARQLHPQVRRIVYASSAAVHSPPAAGTPSPVAATRTPDEARLAPVTHYGVFKAANEGGARVYHLEHGITSIGLRPWTVYGVGRDQGLTSQPTKAMKAIAAGRAYHIGYTGLQDLQYAPDVAGTFLRCLEAPFEGAAVYNMRGAVVDMPQLHRTLCEVAPAAERLITFGGTQIPISYDLDDTRLLSEIGQIPKTPLGEGVRETIEHFAGLARRGRLDLSDLET